MPTSTTAIYTAQTIAGATGLISNTGATAGSLVYQNPNSVNVSAVTGNSFIFNFQFTNGTTPPGPNAIFRFKFNFSSNTYASGFNQIISPFDVSVRVPNVASKVTDINWKDSFPITGDTLYFWYDQENILANTTLTLVGYPVNLGVVLAG